MHTYSILREIADSWVLIALFGFFIGTVVWAYRPGSRQMHEHIGNIPLRDDGPCSADNRAVPGGRNLNRERTGNV